MAAKETLASKPSEPEKVDAYMRACKHALADVIAALRRIGVCFLRTAIPGRWPICLPK
ncbi:MAG TPA: hypothetical protein VMV61_04375 [Patescibacteria group bacterium]|nr:hypothetical protein [Patescibacteria group bacterium]